MDAVYRKAGLIGTIDSIVRAISWKARLRSPLIDVALAALRPAGTEKVLDIGRSLLPSISRPE
jgi:hypothetical protein